MAEDHGRKSIILSIHGVGGQGLPATYVDAEVFSVKLNAFLRALKMADRLANPKSANAIKSNYFISHMRTGSAVIGLTELSNQPHATYAGRSSLETFIYVASAVSSGQFENLAPYAELASTIHNIAKGANRSYSYIELKREDKKTPPLLRIDDRFEYQAERFVTASREIAS